MARVFGGSVLKADLTTGDFKLSDYVEDDEVVMGEALTEDQADEVTAIQELRVDFPDEEGNVTTDDNFVYYYTDGSWRIDMYGGGGYGRRGYGGY